MGFPTRSSRYALRELLLLVIAAAASFVFINHENLYLNHPFRLADARIESYLLATIVIYLFLRVAIIALEMRPPRASDGLVRCPECGQWIDVQSLDGLAAHHRIVLTPKPSSKEIVSARSPSRREAAGSREVQYYRSDDGFYVHYTLPNGLRLETKVSRDGSRVTTSAAGIESTAKAMSATTIAPIVSSSGVPYRRPSCRTSSRPPW